MKTLHISMIVVSMFFTLFVTSPAYAPCAIINGIQECAGPPQLLDTVSTDKLNYENMEKPVITITGVPYTPTHVEIDDATGSVVFSHDLGNLPNGTMNYNLDITSYKPGMYSVIATSPSSKLTTSFTVGLTPTGGGIVLNADKSSYFPGDRVIILGAMSSNTLVQLSLIDPTGISMESTQMFSDNTGHFSLFNFTIPVNAISGIWKISATSGVEHAQILVTVNSTLNINSNIKMDLTMPSPLKQFKSGVAANDVICRPDMQLLIQNQENLPICVKLGSVSNLLRQNWSYPTDCKYVHSPFTAGVESLVMIEKNASNQLSDKSYFPENITVVIGWNNTVSWINQDITPSSVTSNWNLFDSGPILPGADWQHDFECAGNYGYHSDPHPWMKGWIRVLPPSG
jgi:plastocyanin